MRALPCLGMNDFTGDYEASNLQLRVHGLTRETQGSQVLKGERNEFRAL